MSGHVNLKKGVIEYQHDGTVLEGFMVYDDAVERKRPGVLIFHEWTGPGLYVRTRAEQLAYLGYIAFALDIYGKGVRPKGTEAAAAEAAKYRADRQLIRARAYAGLEVLMSHRFTNENRIAAIGYCFGGGAALELARSGADIAGVVSFHGNLDTPDMSDSLNIKAKLLILHGADDPYVPPEQVAAFQEEMRLAAEYDNPVDWHMIIYGGAVHGFTNSGSRDPAKGVAYDKNADKRSWEAMKLFFSEIFK